MYSYTVELLQWFGFNNNTDTFAFMLCIFAGILTCIAVRFIVRLIMVSFFNKLNENKTIPWIGILLKNKFFDKASNLAIPVIISIFSSDMAGEYIIWDIVVKLSLIIIVLYVLDSLIKSINNIYELREISKNIPLRGFLQVIEIIIFITGGIIFISVILQMNPAALLGSLGAMTAITSIIFKDALLGFVAGIQLTAIDMVRIDDVIEMPQHSIMGRVIEISLTTVKVEDFDKNIVSVPAYTLVSEIFINRRGMLKAGVRRIKRSFKIDAMSVCVCDGAMIDKFKKITLLKDYIENKLADIQNHNNNLACDLSEKTNGRRMTNIGVFRAYITVYLKNHRKINQESTLMVRQLEANDNGIPFEVYAFANTTDWAEFEGIQSDIFDHIYAVIQEFGLVLYQNPSSSDIRKIAL